jgi:ribosomal protein S18 acetylase RimI-like enzyme
MNLGDHTWDMSATGISIRRELRDGDADAIAELHRRVYASEYGLNDQFVDGVRRGLQAAVASGWPHDSGAVWLVDGDGSLLGALGLTDEGEGAGRVRWLVLEPSLRGRGLGRSLVTELIEEAKRTGLHKLTLETYSDLTAAAQIYRDAGFRVQWERVHSDWGPQITFQGYALDL